MGVGRQAVIPLDGDDDVASGKEVALDDCPALGDLREHSTYM